MPALGLVPVRLGQGEHAAGAFALVYVLAPGQAGQTPAVIRAAALIHPAVNPSGVVREDAACSIGALGQMRQVCGREHAQALYGRGDAADIRLAR